MSQTSEANGYSLQRYATGSLKTPEMKAWADKQLAASVAVNWLDKPAAKPLSKAMAEAEIARVARGIVASHASVSPEILPSPEG